MKNALKRADQNTVHVTVSKIQFNFEVREWKYNSSRLLRKYSSNTGERNSMGNRFACDLHTSLGTEETSLNTDFLANFPIQTLQIREIFPVAKIF
jgi:hypothetical protein